MWPLTILLIVDVIFLAVFALFTYESIRDQEQRAHKVGMGGAAVMIVLAALILAVPVLRWPIAVLFGVVILLGLLFFIPGKPHPNALKGSLGSMVGEVERVDERDTVFARNRSLTPGSEVYRGHRPNVAMVATTFALPSMLGPHAEPEPDASHPPTELDPRRASEIVKGLARHLGASQVGICRVDPRWAYSRRGEIFYNNWEEWGKELPEPLPYAVVIATEMETKNVGAGPHTPAVVESGVNYARGAYITTMLAGWFAHMG
ncbi:MAG: hypothetical protein P8182_19875 [Deltaproteobacteria bacterium]